jgi:hypothetical protein
MQGSGTPAQTEMAVRLSLVGLDESEPGCTGGAEFRLSQPIAKTNLGDGSDLPEAWLATSCMARLRIGASGPAAKVL